MAKSKPKEHEARIELLKPHRHEDRPRKPGEILDVHKDSAKWLESIGVAKRSNAEETTP